MKKLGFSLIELIIVVVIILMLSSFVLSLGGCQSLKAQFKHIVSGAVGLDRTVTLYNFSGEPMKQWKGRFQIETIDGIASFIVDGKQVKISGIYIIEEN